MMLFLMLNNILMFIWMMSSVTFLTLFERKILLYMKYRKGRNKFMWKFLFKTFGDTFKSMLK